MPSLYLNHMLPVVAVIAAYKNQPTVTGIPINNNRMANVGKGKKPVYVNVQSTTPDSAAVKSKTKPSRAQLGRELSVDLTLNKVSLMIDIVAHSLVAIVPAPDIVHHMKLRTGLGNPSLSHSQTAFIVASSLNCFGVGMTPIAHSLALSMFQLRSLEARNTGTGPNEEDRTGELFGALAVLQAIGQTILAVRCLLYLFDQMLTSLFN